MCSREHKYRWFRPPGTHSSLDCAPGSTNTACLSLDCAPGERRKAFWESALSCSLALSLFRARARALSLSFSLSLSLSLYLSLSLLDGGCRGAETFHNFLQETKQARKAEEARKFAKVCVCACARVRACACLWRRRGSSPKSVCVCVCFLCVCVCVCVCVEEARKFAKVSILENVPLEATTY